MKIFKHQLDPSDAELVVLPVCWSLGADVPFNDKLKPLIDASNDIELFHEFYGYQKGCRISIDSNYKGSEVLDESVSRAIKETDWSNKTQAKASVNLINEDYKKVTSLIEEKVEYWCEHGKLVVAIGGDASLSLGVLRGVSNLKNGFGVFHFGKTPFLKPYKGDLLKEENTFHNVGVKIPEISRIVGVGYQEVSREEYSVQKENKEKIVWFTNRKNSNYKIGGESFSKIVKRWINNLPEFVYVSIHLSILEVYSIEEIEYALQQIVSSRRKIIGLDLSGLDNHVDYKKIANLLYVSCKTFGRSRGKI